MNPWRAAFFGSSAPISRVNMRLLNVVVLLLALLVLVPADAKKKSAKKKRGKKKRKKKVKSAAVPPKVAKRSSQFRKDLDLEALEREWADEEEDDWHEDTREWKEKEKEKERLLAPGPCEAGFDMASFMQASQASNTGGLQMSFVSVHSDEKKVAEEMATRWSTILKSGGVDVKPYVTDKNTILFTQDDGRWFEFKKFVLAQPEVKKLSINNKDHFPEAGQTEL